MFNDLLLSSQLLKSISEMPNESIEAAEEVAKSIIKREVPSVDMESQDNIDLVVRPLALTILAGDLIMKNLFSSTTVSGIANSNTLPDSIKTSLLKSFSEENGIPSVGTSPSDLMSQIEFFLTNKDRSLESHLWNISESNDIIMSMSILDMRSKEMIRNSISYIQLESSEEADFLASENSYQNLVGKSYKRSDFERYQQFKDSKRISIPGVIDVMFSSEVVKETVTVSVSEDGYYHFDDRYYIDISSEKDFEIESKDIFLDGISKTNLRALVSDGLQEEDFTITYYVDPMFENYIDDDSIGFSDVRFFGKYPLFLGLEVETVDPSVSKEDILPIANKYIHDNSGAMDTISTGELMQIMRESSIRGTVSSSCSGKMFYGVRNSADINVSFPVTSKDIVVPSNLNSDRYSKRTINVLVDEVSVSYE